METATPPRSKLARLHYSICTAPPQFITISVHSRRKKGKVKEGLRGERESGIAEAAREGRRLCEF